MGSSSSLDLELAEIVLGTYTLLLQRMDQHELIKPMLKLVMPQICQLFQESNLQRFDGAGLQDEIYRLYESLTSLVEKNSQSQDLQLLEELEELLILCFQSKRSKIKNKISEVWMVAFSSLSSESLSEKLKTVLKKFASPGIKTQMSSSDSQSGELNSFPNTAEFINNVEITEPAIEAALRLPNKPGTPVKNTRLSTRNSPFKPKDLSFKPAFENQLRGSPSPKGSPGKFFFGIVVLKSADPYFLITP